MIEQWYRCNDDDMVDEICSRHYGVSIRATEIVLAHDSNRHLTELGIYLPVGTQVFLPVIPKADLVAKRKGQLIKIFD